MSEPSERMQALVRTLRHAQHQAARTNTVTEDLVVADMELCSAIAELEQRAEKWKRVAVAREMCGRARDNKYYTDRSCGWLLSKRINELEKADSELIEAIAELGKEWTEAVK